MVHMWQPWQSSQYRNHTMDCSFGVCFLAGETEFSHLQSIQTGFKPHPASYSRGTGVLTPRIKELGDEVDQLHPYSAEVKNEWNNISTPPSAFMVCTWITLSAVYTYIFLLYAVSICYHTNNWSTFFHPKWIKLACWIHITVVKAWWYKAGVTFAPLTSCILFHYIW